MLRRIIGGLIGKQASKHIGSMGGTTGMVLGTIAFPIISRMRLSTMLALGAGGYAAKKLMDRKRTAPVAKGPGAMNPGAPRV